MSFVAAYYADYGMPYGKGKDIQHGLNELLNSGYLCQIIVRDLAPKRDLTASELSCLRKPIALGNLLPRALVAGQRLLVHRLPARLWGEMMFDRYASRILPENGKVLLAPMRLTRLVTAAKRKGYTVCLEVLEAHPKVNHQIVLEEMEHWQIPGEYHHPSWHPQLFQRGLESLSDADYLIATSDYSRSTYVKEGFPKERTFVNPKGVDRPDVSISTFSKVKCNKEKVVFLFMGHMSLIKGLFYLLEAWKRLDTSNAHLFLCGEMGRDVRYAFQRRYQNLPNVSYEGIVDPSKYYKSCDVLVFPGLSEGMARVTLEAMAHGLPLIATRESGTIAEDKDSAFLVPARDIDLLTQSMETFIRAPHLIQAMGRRAMQVASKFSWQRYSTGLFEILSRVANSGSVS